MKIVIYSTKYKSFMSVLISLVTMSGYSHGAIFNKGKLYDSTFKRGYFEEAYPIDPERKVAVIEIVGDCTDWIESNKGVRYDILGLLLWPLRIAMAGRMYCFNAVERSLTSVNVHLNLGWRKGGGKIITTFLNKGYKVELMTGKQFHEKYLEE